MKKTFSTLGCPDLNLAQVATISRGFGLDGVELRMLDGKIDLPRHWTECFGSPARLAEVVRELALRVVALGTSLRLIGHQPQDRDEFLAHVRWAEALGVPWLRVFDGGGEGSPDEIAQALRTLDWWRERRRTLGVKVDVMVETHDALARQGPLEAFVRAAPTVAVLWDAHHTWRKGGAALSPVWDLIRSHVVHIHVKDSRADASLTGFRYVLPGTGEFPMKELTGLLQAADYRGVVSLEWERGWHPDLPPLEEALESARRTKWW